MDFLAVGTGFLLGLRHSFDPDHVAAVAHFASADPHPRRGLLQGLRWALGHGAAVLLLAGLLIPVGLTLPEAFEPAAEIAVGMTLIGLAVWRLWVLATQEHDHVHQHAGGVVHSHPHRHGRGHLHAHAPTAMGFLHGLAGALGVLVLLPLGPAGIVPRLLIVLAFCAGTVVSMGLFGWLAARAYVTVARPSRWSWHRLAVQATALSGLALGVVWIARNV